MEYPAMASKSPRSVLLTPFPRIHHSFDGHHDHLPPPFHQQSDYHESVPHHHPFLRTRTLPPATLRATPLVLSLLFCLDLCLCFCRRDHRPPKPPNLLASLPLPFPLFLSSFSTICFTFPVSTLSSSLSPFTFSCASGATSGRFWCWIRRGGFGGGGGRVGGRGGQSRLQFCQSRTFALLRFCWKARREGVVEKTLSASVAVLVPVEAEVRVWLWVIN